MPAALLLSSMPSEKLDAKLIPLHWWIAVFSVAAVLWSIGIGRPVDLPNWHEFDYSAIARNFLREGNNILLPRIDWRGDGPGYTEMEFPLIPWIMAQLYRVFGIYEIIGRLLSLSFALGSICVFRKIALRVLPQPAALIATLFVIVSHEMSMIATAIQPESLMLLCCLLAVYYFVDWYEDKRRLSFWLAICAFALAVLIKSPAAHLAIFFLLWVLVKEGIFAFRRPSLYLFAVLSFALPVAWYSYAASIWHHFHISMGLSNEDHWLGMDILRRPKVIVNFISIDFVDVFGMGGVLVVLSALIGGRFKSSVNRLALTWGLATAIYLVVIMRTASANWAAYYHVVAVPPVALLFGAGVYQAASADSSLPWRRLMLTVAAPFLLIGSVLLWLSHHNMSRMPGVLRDLLAAPVNISQIAVLAVLSLAVTVLCFDLARTSVANVQTTRTNHGFRSLCVVTGCFGCFFLSFQLMRGTWTQFASRSPKYEAAVRFRSELTSPGLIVASGGICQDVAGHRLANDAPNMFYWLDRKGFTTCEGSQSVSELKGFKERGARYFIAETDALQSQPGFEAQVRKSYPLVSSSNAALLFRLDANSN